MIKTPLTLIRVGIPGVRLLVEESKITLPLITLHSCLKFVRIMQEIWNLAHKYTHICIFRKYNFQYQDRLNFADVSFFCKKLALLAKVTRLEINQEKKTMALQFVDMTSSSIFFEGAVFLLSILVIAPSFTSISWLVLEL